MAVTLAAICRHHNTALVVPDREASPAP
jgi:hypothetical protein